MMTEEKNDGKKRFHKGRVHILSEDGTTANTQLFDAGTGEKLDVRAYKVVLTGDAQDEQRMWKAELHTYLPVIDVLADAEIIQRCRFCRQYLPDDWENQDTMLANQVKFFQEMREALKKPLRDALDFQHDIERVRGKLAGLTDSDGDDFPLGHAVAIIETYEKAIIEFLGEKPEDNEEEGV